MKVAVTIEQRFVLTPDGEVWTTNIYPYDYWTRYLEVFSQVEIVARAQPVLMPQPEWKKVCGSQVSFLALPHYLGPWSYLRHTFSIQYCLANVVRAPQALIMVVPSQLANQTFFTVWQTRHPYGLEVIGDPHDAFAPQVIQHPFRAFFQQWFALFLKYQCANADALAYVTEYTLQRKYPPASKAYATFFPNNYLPESAFVATARELAPAKQYPSLLMVGSLAQLYKGPDVLIAAIRQLHQRGLFVHLSLIGDGKYLPFLQQQVQTMNLAQWVHFRGNISFEQVLAAMSQADLLVLPSRTEGLPRVIIEAMAKALPCVATSVGGIPELLEAEDLVPPGDALALAEKIFQVIRDPQRLVMMSERNLRKAKSYRESILMQRRVDFYQHVFESTQGWLNTYHS